MRAEDLYRLMEEPSELTEGTLLELRRIVEDYPYFQVARMLYLKNLAVLNDMSFTSELEKMAIFLPDRKTRILPSSCINVHMVLKNKKRPIDSVINSGSLN